MLGFEVTYKLDEYGWAEINSPITGVSIGLGQVEKPAVPGTRRPGASPTSRPRALPGRKGVRFDGETQDIGGMVKLATFYDPDGEPVHARAERGAQPVLEAAVRQGLRTGGGWPKIRSRT